MPIHPDTGITYGEANPADNSRFVQVYVPDLQAFDIDDANTYNVTDYNAAWPRADGAPVVGGNPQFKWFLKQASPKPTVDHRYYIDTQPELSLTDPAPPEGHPDGVYREIHTPVKYDNATLKAQIETRFQQELLDRFPASNNPSVLLEAADAIARKQDGATLTAAEQAVIDSITGVGDVVKQLRAIQAQFNAAVDAGEDYDITNWTIAE